MSADELANATFELNLLEVAIFGELVFREDNDE